MKQSQGATTAQLREAIDAGRTGSKVPNPDPAASPLGTDDEAAGTPPSAELVEQTLHRETHGSTRSHPIRGSQAKVAEAGPRRWLPIAITVLVLLAIVVLTLLKG